MGKERHDPKAMLGARAAAKATGVDPFSYTSTARNSRGGGAGIHPALNPAFGGKRLCMNPESNEEAVPIVISLDVTGSNIANAKKIWADLPQLLGLLEVQGWVTGRPAIQFMATGDAYWDRFPFQISQFESAGTVLDEWLTRMILEGGGGGGGFETYEIAMWAAVFQNELECWKSGKKGYMFFLFDEKPYTRISLDQLQEIYTADGNPVAADGKELSANMSRSSLDTGVVLPTTEYTREELARMVSEKYHVYCIVSGESDYYNNVEHLTLWRNMFGEENVIQLPDGGDISELIAAIMGSTFGVSTSIITSELKALGTGSVNAIENAIVAFGANSAINPFPAGSNTGDVRRI